MRNKVIWSFLSLAALAVGGLAAGCDSDDKIARSAEGESCAKTSDCSDGLKCLQGTCYKSSSGTGGSDSNAGGDGTGATVTGPTPPVLGTEGESCTKRADCQDGLACLSQRCQKNATVGAGGEGSGPGPTLGDRGETCTLTTDCAKGLSCRPSQVGGLTLIGVCTPVDAGLKPTGKVCGAECVEAADCCELPVAMQAALGAYSCADLAALVDAVPNCDTAVGVNGNICLAYNSYCDDQCGAKTWACEAGMCQYAAKCTKATSVVGGCPEYTRGGNAISPCDIKAGKCAAAVVAPAGCTSDAKCDTGLVVADHPADTCSKGECACDVASGGCYRKCSEPEDCAANYTCDDKSSLCVPLGSCTTDTQCITQSGDYRTKCVDNTCVPPSCEHDIDCNPNGLVNGFFSKVCNDEKKCVTLGCSSNDECGAYPGLNAGGVRSFCTELTTSAPGVVPVSAITD